MFDVSASVVLMDPTPELLAASLIFRMIRAGIMRLKAAYNNAKHQAVLIPKKDRTTVVALSASGTFRTTKPEIPSSTKQDR